MSILNFFKKNKEENVPIITESVAGQTVIPREIFVEERDPQQMNAGNQTHHQSIGIDLVYDFLQADYESKGYNDALVNADESYKNDNLHLIRSDLQILIEKVNTYYTDQIRQLEFHITTRSRSGLIDLVEELKNRKETAIEHMGKMKEISEDMNQGGILTQRVILSYQRGFMRGLAAITRSEFLNIKK